MSEIRIGEKQMDQKHIITFQDNKPRLVQVSGMYPKTEYHYPILCQGQAHTLVASEALYNKIAGCRIHETWEIALMKDGKKKFWETAIRGDLTDAPNPPPPEQQDSPSPAPGPESFAEPADVKRNYEQVNGSAEPDMDRQTSIVRQAAAKNASRQMGPVIVCDEPSRSAATAWFDFWLAKIQGK